MNKYLQNNRFLLSWGILLLLLLNNPILHATTVNISVNGSDQPVATSVGQAVVFDVSVICAGLLEYITGSAQSKENKSKSEVAWTMRNNSASSIRITGFAVSWNCLTDSGNICSSWKFDYLKFDTSAVKGPKKLFEKLSPSTNPFPLTNFDVNVGSGAANKNPYLDIPANSNIKINEIEFVDLKGKKIEKIPSGTKVQFTVTWRDSNNNTYPQIFTVTWP